jgi:hypothetical protein
LQLVGDGATGSALPTFLTSAATYDASIPLTNQTITWANISTNIANEGWNGFALLVDDVEVYVGAALNYSLAALEVGLPHFFRLAVSTLIGIPVLCFGTDDFPRSTLSRIHLVISRCQQPCGRMELGSTRYLDLHKCIL